ncbi:MAG: 16S rRNA (cytosine(1402)-N(4))-methyltransferase RsmH [Candidatus Hydrogenedentota bacterium]
MSLANEHHIPVMKDEVVKFLVYNAEGIIVDSTLGAGGHTKAILESGFRGKVIGLDWDPDAILIANRVLSKYKESVSLHQWNYTRVNDLLDELGIKSVNGFLFDLGISSMQIEDPERGFSYRKDSDLDMRMSKVGRSAKDFLNQASFDELVFVFTEFGEERFSKRIAKKVIDFRKNVKRVETTGELNRIILSCYGIYGRRLKKHPSSRIFQAIRIYLNNEIENLKKGLAEAFRLLKKNGRLVVISYHSLEDRVVKEFIKEKKKEIFSLTKKVVVPAKDEIVINPRARSAKLRAIEKAAGGTV